MSGLTSIADTLLQQTPLHQLLDMGGPVMVVLLTMALIGVITFLYVMLYGAIYAPRLTRNLKSTLRHWQHHPDSVDTLRIRDQSSRLAQKNPLLQLVANAMAARQSNMDTEQIKVTVARDARLAMDPFEAPLKVMEVIAALAPLLGLLGTVIGMMEAFGVMATTEGQPNAAELSGGIYKALTTTAAGLVVAIPFAALAAWVEFRLRRINDVINNTLVTVLNTPCPGPAHPGQSSGESSDITDTGSRHGEPRFDYAVG